MTRLLLWAGAVLLVLLALAGLGWLLAPPDPVAQIRLEMTPKEVESLLGQGRDRLAVSYLVSLADPAGAFRVAPCGFEGEVTAVLHWDLPGRRVGVPFRRRWTAGRDTGLLVAGEVQIAEVEARPPWDRLRTWLGW